MGRARRTKRGEEGRESRKRLEKERERETERERWEEKTEATIVGKIRKWQEMGSREWGADWLPTAPQLQLPFPSRTGPPALPPHTWLGNHCGGLSRRGEHCQRRQEAPSRVRREGGKLGNGREVPASPRTLEAPPLTRLRHPDSARRRQRGMAHVTTGILRQEMTLSPHLGPALEPHSTFTKHLLSARHRAPHSGDTDGSRTHLSTRSF